MNCVLENREDKRKGIRCQMRRDGVFFAPDANFFQSRLISRENSQIRPQLLQHHTLELDHISLLPILKEIRKLSMENSSSPVAVDWELCSRREFSLLRRNNHTNDSSNSGLHHRGPPPAFPNIEKQDSSVDGDDNLEEFFDTILSAYSKTGSLYRDQINTQHEPLDQSTTSLSSLRERKRNKIDFERRHTR